MIIKELIEELKKYDSSMPVYVSDRDDKSLIRYTGNFEIYKAAGHLIIDTATEEQLNLKEKRKKMSNREVPSHKEMHDAIRPLMERYEIGECTQELLVNALVDSIRSIKDAGLEDKDIIRN